MLERLPNRYINLPFTVLDGWVSYLSLLYCPMTFYLTYFVTCFYVPILYLEPVAVACSLLAFLVTCWLARRSPHLSPEHADLLCPHSVDCSDCSDFPGPIPKRSTHRDFLPAPCFTLIYLSVNWWLGSTGQGPNMIPLIAFIGCSEGPCARPFASSVLVTCSLVLSVPRKRQIWCDEW